MVEAYAKEPLLDIIEPPSIPTARGRTIRIQSPWEAIAAKREAELAMEAIKRAGRPGVCVGAAATSGSEIIELAATSYGAFRQTDWHHASFVSENKVSYADLTRAVHFAQTGSIAHTFCDPIYGGYLGGKFGVAIGCVAGPLLLRGTFLGDTVNAGPSHAHLSCDTHPAKDRFITPDRRQSATLGLKGRYWPFSDVEREVFHLERQKNSIKIIYRLTKTGRQFLDNLHSTHSAIRRRYRRVVLSGIAFRS